MNVLCLTYRLPYPVKNGIDLRAFQLLDMLKDDHSVKILSFAYGAEDEAKAKSLVDLGFTVDLVPMSRMAGRLGALRALVSGLPVQVGFYNHPEMRSKVRRFIQTGQVDISFAFLSRMAPYLSEKGPTTMCDFCDAMAPFLKQRAVMRRGRPIALLDGYEGAQMDRWERDVFRRTDGSRIISATDAKFIDPSGSIAIVPNHVSEFLNFRGKVEPLGDRSVILFGEMSSHYSQTAFDFLFHRVMPVVWQESPEAKLFVVGANPTDSIRSAASERVVITGSVGDVRPYVAAASVSVCPVQMGTGLKNKVVQAMAMGVPVVATSRSNEGIGARNGRDLFLADEPAAFASRVLELLESESLRVEVGEAGRQFVQEHFSRSSVKAKLFATLDRAVERHLAGAPR